MVSEVVVRFSLVYYIQHTYLQNGLHRAMRRQQSAVSHKLVILVATILCLFYTR